LISQSVHPLEASNKYGVGEKAILDSIPLARWRCMTADAFSDNIA